MPDNELFSDQNVYVSIPEDDMPGKPLSRVVCQSCGDWGQDRREAIKSKQYFAEDVQMVNITV